MVTNGSRRMQCTMRARLNSPHRNSWRIAGADSQLEQVQERAVRLAIQGSDEDGYHLVMSPEGLFTADYWYLTKAEALESARELFGAEPTDWEEVGDP